MAHLAAIFDQSSTNGHSNSTGSSSNPNLQDPRISLRQQQKQRLDSSSRFDSVNQIGSDQVEAQLRDPISDEEEDNFEEEDGDASSELSTTSGRRHGQLLQPEIEDWVILEVS